MQKRQSQVERLEMQVLRGPSLRGSSLTAPGKELEFTITDHAAPGCPLAAGISAEILRGT